jgi:hypothetical protein
MTANEFTTQKPAENNYSTPQKLKASIIEDNNESPATQGSTRKSPMKGYE